MKQNWYAVVLVTGLLVVCVAALYQFLRDNEAPGDSIASFSEIERLYGEDAAADAARLTEKIVSFGMSHGYDDRRALGVHRIAFQFDPRRHPETAKLNEIWCGPKGVERIAEWIESRLPNGEDDLVLYFVQWDIAASRSDVPSILDSISNILRTIESRPNLQLANLYYFFYRVASSVLSGMKDGTWDKPRSGMLPEEAWRNRKKVTFSTIELIAMCEERGLL